MRRLDQKSRSLRTGGVQPRGNERRLEEAQGIAGVGSWAWDVRTDVVEWSAELFRIYGVAQSDVAGRSADFLALVHPEDREGVGAALQEALRTGQPFELDHRIVRPDGKIRILHCRGQVGCGDDGVPIAMSGTAQDITKWRQQEAALREAEERFRHAFDHAPNGMALVTADGGHLRVNDAMCEITGYSEAELLAMSYVDIVHRDDREAAAEDTRLLLTGQVATRCVERRWARADGAVVWVQVGMSAIYDASAPYLVLQIEDISERRHTEHLSRLLGDISAAISQADDLPTALGAVVDELCSATGWVLGQAWVPDLGGGSLQLCVRRAVVGGFEQFHQASEEMVGAPGVGLPGRVWSSRTSEWISDLRHEGNFPRKQVAGEAGLQAAMACPILAGGDVVAVIELFACEPKTEDLGLLALVSAVAGKLGEAVRRKQGEEALRESELRYRSVTESTPEAIVVASTDGRIVSWNHGASETFGYAAEEVLGRSLTLLMPERFRHAHCAALATLADRGGANALSRRTIELAGVRKNGEEFPIELSLSAWETARGSFVGGIIRDISERKQAEGELARSYEEATHASRLKSEFLATMSHEIRTPMNAVIGMGRLLLDTELDARQQAMAETLARSAYALLALIDDILDFSKVEAGKLELETVAFDVVGTVQDAVAITAEEAHRKGLEVVLSIEPDLPASLTGDAGRLRQVLINLVGNAVKFTDRGEVVVRAGVEQLHPESAVVRFEVADTGPGIAPTRRDALFEPFLQADASTSRRYGGTGLGLAICRRLVELMGGEIGVDSRPGEGSTFWFTARFPRQADEHDAAPPRPSLSGARALVVDANTAQRGALRAQLRSWGVHVDISGDTTSALDRLRQAARSRPYDLVLIDARLCSPEVWLDPGAPGAAARQVAVLVKRGSAPDPKLPTLPTTVRQLVKPVRQSDLFDLMANANAAEQPSHDAPAPPVRAMARGRVLVVEDNLANQQVARLFLESLGYEAEVVDGGAWAIEAMGREPYVAVLMDCQMPGMDGYQATAEIRRREGASRRTPIIAMTAAAIRGDREACLASGMDDYISKPVDPKHLDRVLARWALPVAAGGASGASGAGLPPLGDDQAINWERVRSLQEMCSSGGGADRWPELVALYLDDADQRVAQLHSDAAGDVAVVGDLAHGLKGSSANFGATRVRELSARIEALARGGSLVGVAALVDELAAEVAQARAALCPRPGDDALITGNRAHPLISTGGARCGS